MFPFQPIDLSKLSYTLVWDMVAPIFPGGMIALGWLYRHEDVWHNLHDERILKIIIAGFAIYLVGFVMVYLTVFELVSVAVVVLIRKTEIPEPWRDSEWRKLASRFLGAELSPPVEEPPVVLPNQAATLTNAEALSESIRENFAKRMAPHNFQRRWQRWYEILKARFPMPVNPRTASADLYLSTLNSIGWSGLIAVFISSRHVGWLAWLACVLSIAVAHITFTLNMKQQQYPDPSGDQLAAEILKAIEARDLGTDHRG